MNGESLISINLSNFNTQMVKDTSNMFHDCISLINLISNFNTNSVTDMAGMFNGCESLSEIEMFLILTLKMLLICVLCSMIVNL